MLFAIGKNKSQGYFKPADYELVINQAQDSYIAWLLGSFQTYTPGRPIAKVELGQNMVVRDRLTPVIYGYTLNINATTGISPYPSDFIQADAMWGIYGFNRIKSVQQDSLDSYYNSVIDPIAENPIYLLKDIGFQFYPENQWKAKLSYVRKPPAITWEYNLDSNGRPVYDPSTSVSPIWDDVTMMDIIERGLKLVGLNLQANDIMQYAQEVKANGQ